jgi:hypothetical protein
MYEIFYPEIPGLEPPNPGISGLRKIPGIRDPGIGIPNYDPNYDPLMNSEVDTKSPEHGTSST